MLKKIKWGLLLLLYSGCATMGFNNAPSLLVEANFSNSNPYPNEQTILTYSILTRLDLRYEGFEKEPALPFQWFEERAFSADVPRNVVKRNGVKYVHADIRQIALFPMRPGTFRLQPGVIKAAYKLSPKQEQRTEELLTYSPLTLQVREFPQNGMPSDFNGLAGKFLYVSEQQETEGDFNVLTLQISGEGNIRQLPLPSFDLPQELKIEKVDEKAEAKFEDGKTTGVKTFKVWIRSEKPGSYQIAPSHFSYFDVATGSYVSVKGKPQEVVIERSIPQQVSSIKGNQIHILLDVSGSMTAQDFKPVDRMSIAKSSLRELLTHEKIQRNSTALSAFARNVEEVWPMKSYDPSQPDQLDAIKTTQKNADGTATGSAIYQALKSFEKNGKAKGKRFILLVTDGTRNTGFIDDQTAALLAAEKSIPIYSIVIGKGGKVAFPILDKDFGDREIVTDVEVDFKSVEEISKVTNGKSFAVKSETDLKSAVQELISIFSS